MKSVLSVLEGAVASVTGQRARSAVWEEIQISPQEPPLRIQATTTELTGTAEGIAMVILTWKQIDQKALQNITERMVRAIQTTVGPLHCNNERQHMY